MSHKEVGLAPAPLFDRDPGKDPRPGDIYWHKRRRSHRIFVVKVDGESVFFKFSEKSKVVHKWVKGDWSWLHSCDRIIHLAEPTKVLLPSDERTSRAGTWVTCDE